MTAKQQEMDSVVKEIYAGLEGEPHLQSTLLVLCGDHGMNEAGNHGGSSAGETSPALLFASPKFQGKGMHRDSPVDAVDYMQYYRTVEQADITPTLSGLLGIPIPLNNLGVFIPEFLMMWDHGMHLSITPKHIGYLTLSPSDRPTQVPYPSGELQAIVEYRKGNISWLRLPSGINPIGLRFSNQVWR